MQHKDSTKNLTNCDFRGIDKAIYCSQQRHSTCSICDSFESNACENMIWKHT